MRKFVCLLLALLVAACGGGGGDGNSGGGGGGGTTNLAPRFTSPTSASVSEHKTMVAYLAAATDANNDVLTYSIAGGADRDAFTINGATGVLSFASDPNFEAPNDVDRDNVYHVTLRVQDPSGASATLDVTITVTDDPIDNGFPEFTSADAVSIPENEANLNYTVEAFDPDGVVLLIEISGGPDESHFVLGQDRTLTFVAAKDFEAPDDSDADNQYVVDLTATDDDGNETTLTLTVTVTNVDKLAAELLFPTPNANVGNGRNTDITVTARFTDAEDGIPNVDEATVNGFHLDPVAADPGYWAGRVPLSPGENELSLSARTEDGFTASATQAVNNVLPLADIAALAIDPSGQNVYLSQASLSALQRINLATKASSVFGLSFLPSDFVLAADGNRAFVLAPSTSPSAPNRIFEVDVSAGGSRLVYEDDGGNGTVLSLAKHVEIDEANGRLVVLDLTGAFLDEIDRIVAIGIDTGATSIISDETTGSGPQLLFPENMAADAGLGLLYILNRELGSSARALLSVALSTGARNVISSESIGLGEMPSTPSAVAVDSAAGMAYVVDSTGGVITVNLSTGDKTPLADKPKDHISNGSEKDIALDVANQRLLVTDTDRHKVWAIDTQTGDRSVFFESSTGAGPAMESAHALYFDPDRDRLLVVDENDELIEVDVSTADRITIAGSGMGAGPTNFGDGLAVDLENNRAFVPAGGNAILQVDLATGNRIELSGPNAGFGLPLETVRSPVFDKNGSRLLVIAGITNKTITAIDVVSGDRSILSSTNVGAGAELNSPLNMVLDEAGNRLLVTQNAGPVLAIDLDTGDRSIVSGAGVGSGDAITSTLGIALDADNGRAFVSSFGEVYAIDLATGNRTRMSSLAGNTGVKSSIGSLAWDARRNVPYSPSTALGAIIAMDLHSSDKVIASN